MIQSCLQTVREPATSVDAFETDHPQHQLAEFVARVQVDLGPDLPVVVAGWVVDDLGDLRLLSRYQRARKEEVVLLQSATDAMRKLFAASAPGLLPLRNLGLSLTNKLPLLKSLLIRYALER